jgi:iron(III) transport system ATP-binding protein
VHKAFGDQPVLTGVDLDVVEGSFTALLGASGSGKTTLLRLIAGFERVDRGEIRISGEVVYDADQHVAPERRRLGYVRQDGALFPHLTVTANVGFGLSRAQRRDGRVEDLLAMVGLAGFGARYPHELSGGEQQRVALARALAIEPTLVVLDEPFSSLDAALRQSLRSEVREILRRAGTTALLVTHDQDEALSLADRVAVPRDGRIVQHGLPADLYEAPVDEELATFLGEATVVDGVREGACARTPLGVLALTRPPVATTAAGTEDRRALLRVLVRPEQVELAGPAGPGLAGEVRETTYFGPTSLVRVRPATPCGCKVILARVDGVAHFAAGSTVTMTVGGPVIAWPVA